ncbi:uncharacterized protein [Argopecten irradians]|uniref:uncharacterized protein isoform X2 n=1 Tax=Argopecten irradians TaxID=31199 RepID=UPI003721EF4B
MDKELAISLNPILKLYSVSIETSHLAQILPFLQNFDYGCENHSEELSHLYYNNSSMLYSAISPPSRSQHNPGINGPSLAEGRLLSQYRSEPHSGNKYLADSRFKKRINSVF